MNDTMPENASRAAIAAESEQPQSGLFRFSMTQFLTALIVLVVTYPFVIEMPNGDFIENALMSALFVFAALAIGGRRRAQTVILFALAVAGHWADRIWQGLIPIWILTGTHTAFVAFVVVQLVRFILKANRVNSEVMCAGISGYLMLGILWTPTYVMVSQLNPDSFSGAHLVAGQALDRFDALFLSFVSLTCLGCNDITPLSRVARMLLMAESLTGVLYLAVLIARLVALYSKPDQSAAPAQQS